MICQARSTVSELKYLPKFPSSQVWAVKNWCSTSRLRCPSCVRDARACKTHVPMLESRLACPFSFPVLTSIVLHLSNNWCHSGCPPNSLIGHVWQCLVHNGLAHLIFVTLAPQSNPWRSAHQLHSSHVFMLKRLSQGNGDAILGALQRSIPEALGRLHIREIVSLHECSIGQPIVRSTDHSIDCLNSRTWFWHVLLLARMSNRFVPWPVARSFGLALVRDVLDCSIAQLLTCSVAWAQDALALNGAVHRWWCWISRQQSLSFCCGVDARAMWAASRWRRVLKMDLLSFSHISCWELARTSMRCLTCELRVVLTGGFENG